MNRLRAAALVAAGAWALASCSSAAPRSHSAVPAGSSPPASSTTLAGLTPTVYDCGGGAYEPATLVVVCGVGTTTVTGARWSSWDASGARGTGMVHLGSSARPGSPAELDLSDSVATPQGPQFSLLTATWTGTSPDGRRYDQFHLAVASASG